MSARTYPVVGGAVGATVTAPFWFATGDPGLWLAIPTLVGAVVGAFLGFEFGIGDVKEEWSGWFGAVVMPAVLVAFANLITLFVVAGHGQ